MNSQKQYKKITIIGTSGSGKSTLARKLALKLNIKYIELDQYFWKPGWKEVTKEEFREKVSHEIQAPSWTLCGNFSIVRKEVWGNSTHIIWLNYAFPIVFYRGFKRTLRRVFWREKCCNGNTENFRHAFLSKNSILWWIFKTHSMNQNEYQTLITQKQYSHIQFIEMKHPKETEQWFQNFS